MRLIWDKEHIKKCKENLEKKRYLTEADKSSIDFYNNYLNHDVFVFVPYEEGLETAPTVSELKGKVKEFSFYVDKFLPKMIQNELGTLLDLYGDNCLRQNEYFDICQNVTNKYLVEQSYEIFSKLDKGFTDKLDLIYKNRLVYVDRSGFSLYDDSFCVCDTYNKQGFVYVDYSCEFCKRESILNHEIAHSLSAFSDNTIFDKCSYLYELHSIFMTIYTSNYLYEKTNDIGHIESNANYMRYLKEIISDFKALDILSSLETFTYDSVKEKLEKNDIEIYDMNIFLKRLTDIDMNNNFTYLISSFLALHLLSLDSEKQGRFYSKSMNDNYTTFLKLLKDIEYHINDQFYAVDLFSEHTGHYDYLIRKRYHK